MEKVKPAGEETVPSVPYPEMTRENIDPCEGV
jgi:hypothetical protein